VVFVDEADQMTGKRGGGDSDSGLSGRVYGMLAAEMANTENRGKILWIFATSRPDMVEVDLKRQGRLDVHIPLFPPVDDADKRELFLAMARKLKLGLKPEDLPPLPFPGPVSGNELEGLLVRAYRQFMLAAADAAASPEKPPAGFGLPPARTAPASGEAAGLGTVATVQGVLKAALTAEIAARAAKPAPAEASAQPPAGAAPEAPGTGPAAMEATKTDGTVPPAGDGQKPSPPSATELPASPPNLARILAEVVREFRPSAHTTRLELMDLLAVKECTDERFLPPRFRELDPAAVDQRIEELIRLIPGA
jgi:hypothetical protein